MNSADFEQFEELMSDICVEDVLIEYPRINFCTRGLASYVSFLKTVFGLSPDGIFDITSICCSRGIIRVSSRNIGSLIAPGTSIDPGAEYDKLTYTLDHEINPEALDIQNLEQRTYRDSESVQVMSDVDLYFTVENSSMLVTEIYFAATMMIALPPDFVYTPNFFSFDP